MSGRPIKRLRAVCKAFEGVMKFAPEQAIVGPTGSGKSSLYDAICFALTKRHPDAGKPHLMKPFARNKKLIVELEGEGWSATFRAHVTPDGSFQRTQHDLVGISHEEAGAAIPIIGLSELITLGPDKTREAIVRRFGQDGDVNPILTEQQKPIWDELWSRFEGDASTRLAAMGEFARARTRGITTALSNNEKLRIAAKERVGLGGSHLLPELEKQLRAAEMWERWEREDLPRFTSWQEKRAELEKARLAVLTPGQETARKLDKMKQALVKIDQLISADRAKLDGGKMLLGAQAKLEAGTSSCLLCGHNEPPAPVAKENVKAKVQARLRHLSELQAKKTKIEQAVSSLSAALVKLRDERTKIDKSLREAVKQTLSFESKKPSLPKPEKPLGDLQALVQSARSVAEAQANLEQIELKITDLTQEKTNVVQVTDEIKRTLRELLEVASKRAEEAVRAWLPLKYTPRVQIEEAACEWCIEDKYGLHTWRTMSTTAFTAMRLATWLAWNEDNAIKILWLDDEDFRGLSSDDAHTMLKKLAELRQQGYIDQVIAVRPSDRDTDIPQDWAVQRMK